MRLSIYRMIGAIGGAMIRIKYRIYMLDKNFGGVELGEPLAVNPYGAEMPPFWNKGYNSQEEAYKALGDAGLKGDFVIVPVYTVV